MARQSYVTVPFPSAKWKPCERSCIYVPEEIRKKIYGFYHSEIIFLAGFEGALRDCEGCSSAPRAEWD